MNKFAVQKIRFNAKQTKAKAQNLLFQGDKALLSPASISTCESIISDMEVCLREIRAATETPKEVAPTPLTTPEDKKE